MRYPKELKEQVLKRMMPPANEPVADLAARFNVTTAPHVKIVVLRLLWLFVFSRNGESLMNARRRARHAAARLIDLAEEHQDVLLVGHGFINHFIAKELRKGGWVGPSKPGRGFWGYGIYERATA